MKTATFLNFTKEDFTWNWDNIPFTFKAGESKRMEASQAKHFAKHLTNRELLKTGKENYTSPKFPEQVPEFMAIFNRIIIEESEDMPEAKIDMDLLNKKEVPGIPEEKEFEDLESEEK